MLLVAAASIAGLVVIYLAAIWLYAAPRKPRPGLLERRPDKSALPRWKGN